MATNGIDVPVKLTTGRTVRFPVTQGMKVCQLCEAVAAEENLPAEIVTLKFDGKVLKRSKTMSEYGVREEIVLKVKVLTKKALQVHLHLPGNEVVSFEIYNTSELSEIKAKLLEAKPDLSSKIVHYKIGEMQLNMTNYAYEDCLEDGEKIEVSVKTLAGVGEEPVEEMEEEDRQEVLNSFASSMTSQRKVDIVFSFDTTGSMYSLLSTVQQHLRESITRLMSDIPNIQIGIMAHGDYCDQHKYVLRKHDLSASVADLVSFVNATAGSGGEGYFACYEWVLRHANGLSWREDAAKALVIIGDVVPHPTSYTNQHVNWREELDALCDKQVKVYGVQAHSFQPANSFYGFMARKSGGAHIKFQHFPLITDMFFAVCYRESGDEQLQAYVEEVKNEGRMTEEMMDVMKQLEKKPEEEEKEEEEEENEDLGAAAEASPSRPNRPQEEQYIAEAWWDANLDTEDNNKFSYKKTADVWSRVRNWQPSPVPSRAKHSRMSKKLKGKKGCALM